MIDRDGLDLGQDLVIWLQGWDEDGGGNTRQMEKMEDGDAKQGEQRRMQVHDKKRISSLRFPHGDLFRMSCCQECTLCPESRVVACG